MISKTWISSPCEKSNSDKRESTTSFTNLTLSKVTLRLNKGKKGSKRSRLAIVGEEAGNQADLYSGNAAKDNNYTQDDDLYKEQPMSETTNNSSYVKLKKDKNKKKHKHTESFTEPEIDILVPSTYFKDTSKENKQLKTKRKNKTESVILSTRDVEEDVLSAMDSSVSKTKGAKFSKRKVSLSQSHILNSISDDDDTTHCSTKSLDQSNHEKIKHRSNSIEDFCNESNDCKFGENLQLRQFQNKESVECSDYSSNSGLNNKSFVSPKMTSNLAPSKKKKSYISLCNQLTLPDLNQPPDTKYQENEIKNSQEVDSSDNLNVEDVQQRVGATNNNLYIKLKKDKKKRKHKNSESYTEPEGDIVVPSSCFKETSKKNKLMKIKSKSKTETVISNTNDMEKEVVLSTMDSSVSKLKEGKPSKRKVSLSQSNIDVTISDDNDTTHCSTTSLDQTYHKKRKYITQKTKEPKNNYSCVGHNVNKFDKSEQLTEFQNQKSAELSEYSSWTYPGQSHISLVSPEMSSNLTTPNKKKSYVSSCSQLSSPDFNQSPHIKSPKNETQYIQSVMSSKKAKKKRQSSSLLEDNQISSTLKEINNYFDTKEPNESKESVAKPSPKHKRSMISAEIFNANSTFIDQLNKGLSENELTSNQRHPETKTRQNNIKINDELCTKKTTTKKKVNSKKGKINKSLNKHPDTVLDKKNKDVMCKQSTPRLSVNEPFDIDKIKRDLLAAALKSINKSPKSNKTNRRIKTVDIDYKKPNKETKKKGGKKVSKVIHKDDEESSSVLQSKVATYMSTEDLSQPSTTQDVESIVKVKSAIKPKTNKNISVCKTAKHKSKLHKDKKLDIGKMQQELLAAALKKINSVPIESTKSENAINNNTKPTKAKHVKKIENSTECDGEVSKKQKSVSKKKSKSIVDPLEDFTAKLLSAEMKKRKKV